VWLVHRLIVVAALVGPVACSSRPEPRLLSAAVPQVSSVPELTAIVPLAPGENIRAVQLRRGENSSVAVVQVRRREEPHVHTRYDLTITLLQGAGTLWLSGTALPMRAGDVAFIPKGTPHYFVNGGEAPAVGLVTYAPAFSGPDQAPAPQ
jgi:quercetin dioxygenase-like cupin family protein